MKYNRFHIKSFIHNECKTGYVQDIIVYAESSTMVNTENKAIGNGATVMSLLKPYLGKITLYLDNSYSGPAI